MSLARPHPPKVEEAGHACQEWSSINAKTSFKCYTKTMKNFKNKIKSLRKSPGVYIFKDAKGKVLYVGKAKNLRSRVWSYFNSTHDIEPKTQILVSKIDDLEYILTDTETEALMLENNLIKKYQPRYNILLRDDKNYQFIKIDYSTEIPQIYTTRKIDQRKNSPPLQGGVRGGIYSKVIANKTSPNLPFTRGGRSRYFGPYTSGKSVRDTLRLIRYIFSYCSNTKIGTRPCFYYHLSRCPGVCAKKITIDQYRRHLKKIERFLAGEMQRSVKDLQKEMKTAAKKKLFERAARLRDQSRALVRMLEKQKIISPTRESHDTISLFQAGNLAAVTLFQIRQGKLIGRENFILENAKDQPENEILKAFLKRYYLEASDVPKEINLPSKSGDISNLEKLLSQKAGKTIHITTPSRGRKAKLIKLGKTNAQDHLEKISQNLSREQAQLTRALFMLKDQLKLPEVPLRIEAFDISNIQGTNPTGSMVVFENGKPKKNHYKRFAIRSLNTPNDVHMMKEMLARRLARSSPPSGDRPLASPSTSRSGQVDKSQNPNIKITKSGHQNSRQELESWRLPDLIVVDGGRAQLNVALSILKEKRLKIPVIGLAKKLEEIYRPNIEIPLRLPGDSPALHLLQRLRDEAHRFAITYHRKKRSKSMTDD